MTRTEQDAYLKNAAMCLANESEARACGDHEHAARLHRKAQAWRIAANGNASEKERQDALDWLDRFEREQGIRS